MGNGTTGSSTPGNGTNSGGTPTTDIHYSGHEYSTPSVQGSYFAGANPCLIGVGASGSGGPIGLSFTFGRNDQGCQRRSDAAAWHALGRDEVAVARMCQDDDNRAAFESVGFLCPQNRAKVALATIVAPASPSVTGSNPQQSMTYPQPVFPNPTIALQPTPGAVAARLPAATGRPDLCGTVTGMKEREHYKSACSF